MSDEGFTKMGYEFVLLDDGWQADYRNGVLPQPNSTRFPNGMMDLANYVISSKNKHTILVVFCKPIFGLDYRYTVKV